DGAAREGAAFLVAVNLARQAPPPCLELPDWMAVPSVEGLLSMVTAEIEEDVGQQGEGEVGIDTPWVVGAETAGGIGTEVTVNDGQTAQLLSAALENLQCVVCFKSFPASCGMRCGVESHFTCAECVDQRTSFEVMVEDVGEPGELETEGWAVGLGGQIENSSREIEEEGVIGAQVCRLWV
ncbi:hypothetical protein B484DRAFT_410261, partial [Ochromonadaceae sp. CCMP2298]